MNAKFDLTLAYRFYERTLRRADVEKAVARGALADDGRPPALTALVAEAVGVVLIQSALARLRVFARKNVQNQRVERLLSTVFHTRRGRDHGAGANEQWDLVKRNKQADFTRACVGAARKPVNPLAGRKPNHDRSAASSRVHRRRLSGE